MAKQELEIDSTFLEIDRDSLDEEWINQPELFFKYASRSAKASREVDEAKAELEVVKAELDKRIRSNPGKFGVGKISEKAIEGAMARTSEFQDATETYIKAKYQEGILSAAVKALDQRKKALEKLVELHGQNYFSTPKAGEHSREAVDDIERTAARKRSAIKRRKNEDDDEDDE